jgi:CRISPR-associated RAMP protein (TIGR02581 family)
MFDKFANRLKIEAALVTKTGVHIGAGEDSFDPTAMNGAVVRYHDGTPYMPGSSLKGVFRAFCASVDPEFDGEDDWLNEHSTKEARAELGEGKKLAEEIVAHSSITHRLFGSPLMAGKVHFADAVPQDNRVRTEDRKGNAINRDTHTAVGGALFDMEFISADARFVFRLSADNLAPDEGNQLFNLLGYFAQGGIRVGGRSRAGFGEVKLDDIKCELYLPGPDGFPVKTTALDIPAAKEALGIV